MVRLIRLAEANGSAKLKGPPRRSVSPRIAQEGARDT